VHHFFSSDLIPISARWRFLLYFLNELADVVPLAFGMKTCRRLVSRRFRLFSSFCEALFHRDEKPLIGRGLFSPRPSLRTRAPPSRSARRSPSVQGYHGRIPSCRQPSWIFEPPRDRSEFVVISAIFIGLGCRCRLAVSQCFQNFKFLTHGFRSDFWLTAFPVQTRLRGKVS